MSLLARLGLKKKKRIVQPDRNDPVVERRLNNIKDRAGKRPRGTVREVVSGLAEGDG